MVQITCEKDEVDTRALPKGQSFSCLEEIC